MLIAWLHDHNSSDWPVGLKFVQFSKNISHHAQSPYEALFGVKARIGLRSSSLPDEILGRMASEDDLLAAFQQNTSDVHTGTDLIFSIFLYFIALEIMFNVLLKS